jgi:hypothetical protein
MVHAMLFNSYFQNWRRFLKEKGDIFSHDVCLKLVEDIWLLLTS